MNTRTTQQVKEDVADLESISDDIGMIISNIKAGANDSRMSFLERKGIETLCQEAYGRLEKLNTEIGEISRCDIVCPERKQAA